MKKRIIAMVLCIVMCLCIFPINAFAASRDTSFEEGLASRLKALGLFKGVSDTDFDLNRAPTRVEALVMLIRTLGQEDEALDGNWKHPFKDVPQWADKYVGYAYEKGLTNGVSSTQFGTDNATAATYLTFVLRALGYSDTNNQDFSWKDPFTLAKSIGILPSAVNTSNFWRADAVMISYAALPVKLKGASETLSQKLISAGVYTERMYRLYYDTAAFASRNQNSSEGSLSADEIYEMCSPAVFTIETWDIGGLKIGSGSGFFIDSSGIALTSYDVLENAYCAKVTTADGKEYNVTSVVRWNPVYDWVVFKVEGSGFSALTVGDSSKVESGATVYELGSPLGVNRTAIKGVVLNPDVINTNNRGSYIETSIPISYANSGGALVNAYGEAIGISATFYSKRENVHCSVPINVPAVEAMRRHFSDSSITTAAEAMKRLRELDINENSTFIKYAVASEKQFVSYALTDRWNYYANYENEREPNDWPDYQMSIDNLTTVYGELTGDDNDTFRICCNGRGYIYATLILESDDLKDKIHISCYNEKREELSYADSLKVEGMGFGRYKLEAHWWNESKQPLEPGVYYIKVYFDSNIQPENLNVEYELWTYYIPEDD